MPARFNSKNAGMKPALLMVIIIKYGIIYAITNRNIMNQYLEKLIWLHEEREEKRHINEDKIQVNEFVGKMASIYEKMRNSFDFKDAHILRKNAIHRMLKRHFFLSNDSNKIARYLASELVRGGYLPNNSVTDSKVESIAKIVAKYLLIKEGIAFKVVKKNEINKWLIEMASCEIDEEVVPPELDEALVDVMFQEMSRRVKLANIKIKEKEYNIQLYIAVLRAIRKLDKSLIEYNLLKFYSPKWRDYGRENIKAIVNKIDYAKELIQTKAKSPIADRFYSAVKKQVPPYRIIKEIIEQDPKEAREIFSNEEKREETIQIITKSKYKTTRSKLARGAIRAIIYVLLTKIFLAVLIEMPYEFFVLKEYNYFALGVNILFHPILLFFLAITASLPREKNTLALIERIGQILNSDYRELEQIRIKISRPSAKRSVFNFFYLLITLGFFALIVWGLASVGFNIVSIILFVVFLCVVSFLGIRVRNIAKEYKINTGKVGALRALIDFLALPIVRTGKLLTMNFSRINVLVMFLDIAFEAPFKLILQYMDEWFSFLREKRDEISD